MAATERSVDLLSARERSVVKHIAEGLTYAETAQELGIGQATVKMHLDNVRRKLKMKYRTQIAVWWVRLNP